MIYFDIGCNQGQWIETNYTDEDIFIGVEANPAVYEKTKERFISFDNITILNFAVSDKCGEIDFYPEVFDSNHVASTASKFWISHGRFKGVCSWPVSIKIESITLDSLIKLFGNPCHVKIDVEGYELTVLQGLTKPVQSLSFEWVEEQRDELLLSVGYLFSLGYKKFNYLLNRDTYDYFPTEFMDIKGILEFIKELQPERKKEWGMIYAYL